MSKGNGQHKDGLHKLLEKAKELGLDQAQV